MLILLFITSLYILLISPFTLHATVDLKLLSVLVVQPILLLYFLPKKLSYNDLKKSKYIYTNIFIFFTLIILQLLYWNFSKYPYYSTRIVSSFWSSILCFLSGIFILNNKHTNIKILKSIVLISTLSSIYVLLEYFGFVRDLQIHKFPIEVTGHIGHKNIFGFVSMISLIISIFIVKNNHGSFLYFLSSIVIFIALLLSDSRGSLILSILGISIFSFPIIINNQLYKKLNFRIIFYIIIVTIILIPLYFWNEKTLIRIAKLFIENSSHSHRSEIYKSQISMIIQSPIWGNGMGSFIHENLYHSTSWFRDNLSSLPKTLNGHCEYLEIHAEYGIFGGILYFYFWFGALFLGIKKLKYKWNDLDFTLIISLTLMMIHASFSIASRRLPSSALIWLIIGYFWSPQFLKIYESFSNKTITYFKLVISLLSIIILFSFTKVLIGDYFYETSRVGLKMNKTTIMRLEKSIKFFPNHPYSLFRMSKFALGVREYDYAIQLSETLDEISPNIFNSNYIKGEAFFFKEQMDSALIYANKELNLRNKHFESLFLKSKIYAFTNNEKELNKSKNLITYTYFNRKIKRRINYNPIREDNKRYNKLVGPLRAKFSGPYLKIAWYEYKEFNNNNSLHKNIINKNTLKLKTNLTTP